MLIIDDNEGISSLLTSFFQSKGFAVHTASDGPSGIQKARELLPDIITLDFNMPGMNGVEVYNELRRQPETTVIPVIFFSSTLLGIIKRMILDNPRVQFIKKPCSPADIEKCVNALLALPKLAPPPPPPPPPAKPGNTQPK